MCCHPAITLSCLCVRNEATTGGQFTKLDRPTGLLFKLKIQNSSFTWVPALKLLSGECHKSSLIRGQHWLLEYTVTPSLIGWVHTQNDPWMLFIKPWMPFWLAVLALQGTWMKCRTVMKELRWLIPHGRMHNLWKGVGKIGKLVLYEMLIFCNQGGLEAQINGWIRHL